MEGGHARATESSEEVVMLDAPAAAAQRADVAALTPSKRGAAGDGVAEHARKTRRVESGRASDAAGLVPSRALSSQRAAPRQQQQQQQQRQPLRQQPNQQQPRQQSALEAGRAEMDERHARFLAQQRAVAAQPVPDADVRDRLEEARRSLDECYERGEKAQLEIMAARVEALTLWPPWVARRTADFLAALERESELVGVVHHASLPPPVGEPQQGEQPGDSGDNGEAGSEQAAADGCGDKAEEVQDE